MTGSTSYRGWRPRTAGGVGSRDPTGDPAGSEGGPRRAEASAGDSRANQFPPCWANPPELTRRVPEAVEGDPDRLSPGRWRPRMTIVGHANTGETGSHGCALVAQRKTAYANIA